MAYPTDQVAAQQLLALCAMDLESNGQALPFLEEFCGQRVVVTGDTAELRRNLPTTYASLFDPKTRVVIEQLFDKALGKLEMRQRLDPEGDKLIAVLSFIQTISATAMFRFHLDVGPRLAQFVRDFDRLDVPSERKRLHLAAACLRTPLKP